MSVPVELLLIVKFKVTTESHPDALVKVNVGVLVELLYVTPSIHAFIDRQSGSVYKPASWKAPAKHVRYNLLDDVSYETCLHNADWAGSYLYMN